MSERPTPITDDHVKELRRNPEVSGCNRTLEFARNLERQLGTVTDAFNEQVNRRHNLERQLAEAQAQLRIADEQLALERGALAAALRERDEARRERDNALSDWRQADSDTARALHERNEARAEIERLNDLLEKIVCRYAEQEERLKSPMMDHPLARELSDEARMRHGVI